VIVMGRDLIGIIVFAKNKDEALSKAYRILDKLVRKRYLWFFYTLDQYDSGNGNKILDLPSVKENKYKPVMRVDKPCNSKGYRFITSILDGWYKDQFLKNMKELRERLEENTNDEELFITDKVWDKGAKTCDDFGYFRSLLGSIADSDEYVTELYAEGCGKVRSYDDLESVLCKYTDCYSEFSKPPRKTRKLWEDNMKIYVVPAFSKT
jgi:hypothetical protein